MGFSLEFSFGLFCFFVVWKYDLSVKLRQSDTVTKYSIEHFTINGFIFIVFLLPKKGFCKNLPLQLLYFALKALQILLVF